MVSRDTPRIQWHRRFEARVAMGVSLVVAATLVAVLAATAQIVRTNSLRRATDDLEAARAAFYHLVESRAQFAAAQLRLIAELPVFRAHLTDARIAGDSATIHEMAAEYRRSLKAHFMIVADPSGKWIAGPGWSTGLRVPGEMADTIAAAGAGRSHRAIVAIQNRLYLVVSEPARFADEVLATLTAGYQLDDAVARELAVTTRCDVNFVTDGQLSGSSLPAARRQSLLAIVGSNQALGLSSRAELRAVGEARYVTGTYPLHPDPDRSSSGTLVLLQDWAATQHFVDQIRTRLLWLGGITFALALASAVLVSRKMTRPLREVAAVAGDIASGRRERTVPVHGTGEAAAMATAFNHMTASLNESYDQLRQREQQLRQAQKMEAVGRLAGGVAHDFNNLLTAIQGYGEMLFGDLRGDDTEGRAKIIEILKAVDSASSLTRQLLAFSRKQLLAPKVVSLHDIVRGMEKILRRLIGEDIELSVRSQPELWNVLADPGQLEQVIMNLALNARDAMPHGGHLVIALENVDKADGQYVTLAVTDDGCGIDAAAMSHLFEPFFTTKEEGRGTGLGLATVHGIVEQSGGTITVDSTPGRGTTFRVTLPRATAEQVVERPDPSRVSTDTRSETVLIAEDEPSVRRLAGEVLRGEGYHVLEAGRGDEALKVAARHDGDIHLLLSDVVMPGMSGRDLWERLSAARPDTKVLFMSGYTDDAVVRHGIRDKGFPFLQKPFSLGALAAAVQQAIADDSGSRS